MKEKKKEKKIYAHARMYDNVGNIRDTTSVFSVRRILDVVLLFEKSKTKTARRFALRRRRNDDDGIG